MKEQGATNHPGKEMRNEPLDMERLVGYILLTGVLLSVALLSVGFVWRWVRVGSLRFEHSIVGMNFFDILARPFHWRRFFDTFPFPISALWDFRLLFSEQVP